MTRRSINNIMVTSADTAKRVTVEEIRIASGQAFESEEIVWQLFQNETRPPDLIVCLDEVDTETVYQAVIDYNQVGKTQIIGYYISPTALAAVKRGTMSKTLYIDAGELGSYSVRAMTECIRDGRTNSFYSIDRSAYYQIASKLPPSPRVLRCVEEPGILKSVEEVLKSFYRGIFKPAKVSSKIV